MDGPVPAAATVDRAGQQLHRCGAARRRYRAAALAARGQGGTRRRARKGGRGACGRAGRCPGVLPTAPFRASLRTPVPGGRQKCAVPGDRRRQPARRGARRIARRQGHDRGHRTGGQRAADRVERPRAPTGRARAGDGVRFPPPRVGHSLDGRWFPARVRPRPRRLRPLAPMALQLWQGGAQPVPDGGGHKPCPAGPRRARPAWAGPRGSAPRQRPGPEEREGAAGRCLPPHRPVHLQQGRGPRP